MRTSEQLDKLGAALAKAQASIQGARKDTKNTHLKVSYADLAACWEACREALTANGLSIVQAPSSADNTITVCTTLLHESGQWMQSELTLPWGPTKGLTDAQAIGSAISYARRYGLCAMVGIAPDDDDDGHAAGSRPRQQARPKPDPAAIRAEMERRAVGLETEVGAATVRRVRQGLGIDVKAPLKALDDDQLKAYGSALKTESAKATKGGES